MLSSGTLKFTEILTTHDLCMSILDVYMYSEYFISSVELSL